MSRYIAGKETVTVTSVAVKKAKGEKLTMVTCYDAAFARIVDRSSVDMVLVGDSLGNVMLGFDNTIPVTMAAMIHHCASVARVLVRPLLVADMPFFSYHVSLKQALTNAARLVQEGGAQAVKIEGGAEVATQVKALVRAGIPVMGHLGLTPQSIHTIGGYKVQGRGEAGEQEMVENALALQDAGAFAVVLELVPQHLAQVITKKLRIPTIGIGAGPGTDGQVLVLHDLLGFDTEFKPKFLKQYASIGQQTAAALEQYVVEVREGVFPGVEHSFN